MGTGLGGAADAAKKRNMRHYLHKSSKSVQKKGGEPVRKIVTRQRVKVIHFVRKANGAMGFNTRWEWRDVHAN